MQLYKRFGIILLMLWLPSFLHNKNNDDDNEKNTDEDGSWEFEGMETDYSKKVIPVNDLKLSIAINLYPLSCKLVTQIPYWVKPDKEGRRKAMRNDPNVNRFWFSETPVRQPLGITQAKKEMQHQNLGPTNKTGACYVVKNKWINKREDKNNSSSYIPPRQISIQYCYHITHQKRMPLLSMHNTNV